MSDTCDACCSQPALYCSARVRTYRFAVLLPIRQLLFQLPSSSAGATACTIMHVDSRIRGALRAQAAFESTQAHLGNLMQCCIIGRSLHRHRVATTQALGAPELNINRRSIKNSREPVTYVRLRSLRADGAAGVPYMAPSLFQRDTWCAARLSPLVLTDVTSKTPKRRVCLTINASRSRSSALDASSQSARLRASSRSSAWIASLRRKKQRGKRNKFTHSPAPLFTQSRDAITRLHKIQCAAHNKTQRHRGAYLRDRISSSNMRVLVSSTPRLICAFIQRSA